MNPDDEIHPWNGHHGTPQDRLAVGCAWFVGIGIACMVFSAIGEIITKWIGS